MKNGRIPYKAVTSFQRFVLVYIKATNRKQFGRLVFLHVTIKPPHIKFSQLNC